jgi:integrase/recombinase XerD
MTRRTNRVRQRTSKGTATSRLPTLQLELVIDEYERDCRRRTLSPKTIHNYLQALQAARAYWEGTLGRPLTLDDVTVRLAERYLDYLLERGKAPTSHRTEGGPALSRESLRTYLRSLKVFSSWLAAPKQGYTADNRLKLLQLPRKSETFKQPLEPEEVQALLDQCDTGTVWGTRDLAILLTYLDGALRAMDLANLLVGDVNLETGQLFIAASKRQKSRTVAVGDITRRMLRRYAFLRDASAGAKASTDAPFFQNKQHRRFGYEGLRRILKTIKGRAGVERAFLHLLRHTSAVRTLEVPGSDLVTLQEKLGHADITTTRRYIHMSAKTLSERQRAFSPIDHLRPAGLARLDPPTLQQPHYYRKRRRETNSKTDRLAPEPSLDPSGGSEESDS